MNATPNASKLAGEMMDAWMASYKSVNWGQDQVQTLAGSWMEQTRTMRHDAEKVFEVLMAQAKTNVEEMTRLSEAGLQNALHYVPNWDAMTQGDLRRQVEELNKRVGELSAR